MFVIKNKNIQRALSLGIGLTILSCSDNKGEVMVGVSGDEKGFTSEEKEFISAAENGNDEKVFVELYGKIGIDALECAIDKALDNKNRCFLDFLQYKVFPAVCDNFEIDEDGKLLLCLLSRSENFAAVRSTPLHWAVQEGNVDVCEFLIVNGADVNAQDAEGNTPLLWAAIMGHVNVCKFLINNGANVNAPDTNGGTPLHMAVRIGNCEGVQCLVFLGADIDDSKDKDGNTPLQLARNNRNIDIVNFLSGITSERTRRGKIFVMSAINGGRRQLEELYSKPYLISDEAIQRAIMGNITHNVNLDFLIFFQHVMFPVISYEFETFGFHRDLVNFLTLEWEGLQNLYKDTPFHWAIIHGSLPMVKFFFENVNIDLDSRNVDGDTPLLVAVRGDHLEIAKYLIENGANVNIRDKWGYSPLLLAVNKGNLPITKLLIKNGANLNVRDPFGSTPLHMAVTNMNYPMVELFIKANADVNAQDGNMNTPLHLAVLNSFDLVLLFLTESENVDVNISNCNGETPLGMAIDRNLKDMTEQLKEKSISENVIGRNKFAFNELVFITFAKKNDDIIGDWWFSRDRGEISIEAIQQAIIVALKNRSSIFLYFFLNYIFPTLSTTYTAEEYRRLVSFFRQELGMEIIFSIYGSTPLHWVAHDRENVELMECWFDDVDVDVQDVYFGFTPLYLALKNRNYELVTHLVNLGANLNIQNYKGQVPLHLATSDNDLPLVKFLIEKWGADIDIQDCNGETPLYIAIRKGYYDIANYLRNKGARIDVQDKNGLPLLYYIDEDKLQEDHL